MVRAQPVLERLPFEKLHDDERLALMSADLVDGTNIRVVEG